MEINKDLTHFRKSEFKTRHRPKGSPGGSAGKELAYNAGNPGSIPELGSSLEKE